MVLSTALPHLRARRPGSTGSLITWAMNHQLSILLLLPTFGAAAILFLPSAKPMRWTALGITLFTFIFALTLLFRFDAHSSTTFGFRTRHGDVQLVERAACVPSLHIEYLVGIDGLSLPLILLTTFLFPLACAASWKIDRSPKLYFALLLFLESAILGVFLSLDLLIFCVFLEASFVPVYFLIGVWGGPRKRSAAIKLLFFMLIESAAMLTALIAIYASTHCFDMIRLPGLLAAPFASADAPSHLQTLLFLLLMFAIAIKLPAVPFHTWLLDAQAQAPTAVSMILAALLLKIGGYAIFRIAYPFFPAVARHLWFPIALIGTISVLYGVLCAMSQNDFKKLLAYSSISQMGFITLGAAMITPAAVNGAIFLMVAHGITSAMMFFSAGVLADRATPGPHPSRRTRFGDAPVLRAVRRRMFRGHRGAAALRIRRRDPDHARNLPGLAARRSTVRFRLRLSRKNRHACHPRGAGSRAGSRLHAQDHAAHLLRT